MDRHTATRVIYSPSSIYIFISRTLHYATIWACKQTKHLLMSRRTPTSSQYHSMSGENRDNRARGPPWPLRSNATDSARCNCKRRAKRTGARSAEPVEEAETKQNETEQDDSCIITAHEREKQIRDNHRGRTHRERITTSTAHRIDTCMSGRPDTRLRPRPVLVMFGIAASLVLARRPGNNTPPDRQSVARPGRSMHAAVDDRHTYKHNNTSSNITCVF